MQVAVSVIDELSRLPDCSDDLTILASDEVHADYSSWEVIYPGLEIMKSLIPMGFLLYGPG